ncbi:N-acetyltransferase (plasmid) [Paroceanicella profunda]|uniref:N-acetyltransferase n=1 Tax=Paroceanicella profunda TaxID=2579971 RepID=A0A5B8G568_9RHOB|nr:GNAT family N-acetyltransferase [Paroceanicella profunda]QDL94103.1 N-acetyltransferase [Paroceanicella profunda]
MTRPEPQISFEETETKGRFVARVPGVEGEGELTISKVSDVLIIADHTLVPDSMRGMGVGGALAESLIARARAKGQRIVPLCPFVRAQALRHPEWSDVIQG